MLRFLCSRCGAVVEPPASTGGEEVHGACPECGLGFVTSSAVTATRTAGAAVAPEAAARRHDALRRQALAAWTDPLFGLDASWTGTRRIGGWAEGDGQLERIDLSHGDVVEADAPWVEVATHRVDGMSTTIHAAQALAWTLFHETGEHTDRHRDPFRGGEPSTWWDPVGLIVDGAPEPVPFRLLRSGARWVAIGAVGGQVIGIVARHLEPESVHLDEVDVEPYLADDAGLRSVRAPVMGKFSSHVDENQPVTAGLVADDREAG